MPGGPTPFGLLIFAGVKLAGYSVAGRVLSRAYQPEEDRPPALLESRPFLRRPIAFGLARTILGIATGITWATVLSQSAPVSGLTGFYASLIPVRMVEWSLMIWLFYERYERNLRRLWRYSAYGTGWSYLLDLPAVLGAIVVPGGIWVC